ncbi:MAG: hypothetical protein KKB20_00295 [Proteobacteria bacterium]|nr:hypothetical protein [Pseudomonadota bacterium]
MKKRDQAALERVMQKLATAASRRPEEPALSEAWRRRVMKDVRIAAARKTIIPIENNGANAFAGLLFRFAGAGALIAVFLLIYVTQFSPDVFGETARLVFEGVLQVLPVEHILWS